MGAAAAAVAAATTEASRASRRARPDKGRRVVGARVRAEEEATRANSSKVVGREALTTMGAGSRRLSSASRAHVGPHPGQRRASRLASHRRGREVFAEVGKPAP